MNGPVPIRDHGGGIDAAAAYYGGARGDWLDLSTGINPIPYPVGHIAEQAWMALPDATAMDGLLRAAREFWNVPDTAGIVAAPGASALIARLPGLVAGGEVCIPGPTYNEHAAAFRAAGWDVGDDPTAPVHVYVHPNNPDGRLAPAAVRLPHSLTVIDESFCDICLDESLITLTDRPGVVVLKSFGKFWGLAGLRLGFAIGDPPTMTRLQEMLGPWAVSGPALGIGTRALQDWDWAVATRARLRADAARLDAMMARTGADPVGGTPLFRLYSVDDAQAWQGRLARAQIWSRVFPYSDTWLRLGLPGDEVDWARIAEALE